MKNPNLLFLGFFFWLQEIADDNCVYRNEVHHSVAERTQVLQDVAADPTLPRTKAVTCTVCKHPEAVFFQVSAIFYAILCRWEFSLFFFFSIGFSRIFGVWVC
jgi:DNA-directed RNA polymerase II subunit RPB9